MTNSKRIKVIVASLSQQGCTIKDTKKGYIVFFPDEAKTSMVLHYSDSDHRAEANTRSRVLRAGLAWPFDGQRRS